MSGKAWGDLVAPLPSTAPTALAARNGAHGGFVYQRAYEWRAYPETAPLVSYKADQADPDSEIVEEPARWWTARSIGFRAKVLVNPLGGEVRLEMQRYVGAHYLNAQGQFSVTDAEYLETIADRVAAWEFAVIDDDGTRREIPAPGVPVGDGGGWERFYDLPNDCLVWLREEIRGAHLPKAPTRTPSRRAGPTASAEPKKEPDAADTTDPDPGPPPS